MYLLWESVIPLFRYKKPLQSVNIAVRKCPSIFQKVSSLTENQEWQRFHSSIGYHRCHKAEVGMRAM